jgi:hypothetical protein
LPKKSSGQSGPEKGLERPCFERLEALSELTHVLLTEDLGGAERATGAFFLKGDVTPPEPGIPEGTKVGDPRPATSLEGAGLHRRGAVRRRLVQRLGKIAQMGVGVTEQIFPPHFEGRKWDQALTILYQDLERVVLFRE